jgi:DNA uptake protein ComE-like DNA-binding protein
MWWRRFVDGLRFNKRERQGLFVFLLVLTAVTAYFYQGGHSTMNNAERSMAFQQAKRKLDSLDHYLDSLRTTNFFLFDPNKADSSLLDSLGLNPFVAKRWESYLSSGGFFVKEEDVLKVYGIDSIWWKEAKSYMLFGAVNTTADSSEVANSEDEYFRFLPDTMEQSDWIRLGLTPGQASAVVRYLEKTTSPVEMEDLDRIYVLDKDFLQRIAPYVVFKDSSSTDSNAVKKIPINIIDAPALSVLTKWPLTKAEKLVKYRDKLGGFHSSYQVWETWGLDSTDLMPMQGRWDLQSLNLLRIDVNSASLEELKDHPYINYESAKAIVEFRENVRPFRSIEELERMRLMSERKMAKLAPYLMFIY